MNKKIIVLLLGFGLIVLFGYTAYAINITVPSSPAGGGYFLISTSTGAYVATSTNPAHFDSIYASTTNATSTFLGGMFLNSLQVSTTTATTTVAGGLFANLLSAPNFNATSTNATSTFMGSLDVRGNILVAGNLIAPVTLIDSSNLQVNGTLTVTGNTSLQTITSGTWNGTVIGSTYGGTGQNFSVSTGAISVSSGTFSAGTLSVGNGGTGATTFTSNGVLYGNGAGAFQVTAQGAANSILIANAGAPSFSATPTIGTSLTVPTIIGGTAIGSSLSLQSTSGVGTTDFIRFLVGNNGGTEAMRITTSGNVGIGTTSPYKTLAVTVPVNGATVLSAPGTVDLTIVNTAGTQSKGYSLRTGYSSNTDVALFDLQQNDAVWQAQGGSGGNAGNFIIEPNNGGGKVGIGTTSPGALFALGNGAASGGVYMTSAGNVGVGIPAPVYPLQIQTNLASNNISRIYNTNTSAGARGLEVITGSNTATDYALYVRGNDGNAATLWAGANGNVGIGTTSPTVRLGITSAGTTGEAFAVANSSNIERFTVMDGGNVGVGTTSPTTRFGIQDVANFSAIASSTVYQGVITSGLMATSSGLTVTGKALFTSGVSMSNLSAFASGDSAVCQKTNGGEISVDSGVSSCIVSTRKVKHDIANVISSEALSRVIRLNPVSFIYNETNKPDIGLIAEDAAKVDIRYAQYNNKGEARAINWSAIQADLISVSQDMLRKIKYIYTVLISHEDRIGKLERENVLLKARIEKLEKKL